MLILGEQLLFKNMFLHSESLKAGNKENLSYFFKIFALYSLGAVCGSKS